MTTYRVRHPLLGAAWIPVDADDAENAALKAADMIDRGELRGNAPPMWPIAAGGATAEILVRGSAVDDDEIFIVTGFIIKAFYRAERK